ncbi:hypothetical protein ACWDX8_30440, partial [Streptomyces anthocyanicus]
LVLAAGFPGSDAALVTAVALATAPFSTRVLRGKDRAGRAGGRRKSRRFTGRPTKIASTCGDQGDETAVAAFTSCFPLLA